MTGGPRGRGRRGLCGALRLAEARGAGEARAGGGPERRTGLMEGSAGRTRPAERERERERRVPAGK